MLSGYCRRSSLNVMPCARGLRSIIEEVMRNVMYEVPSRIDVVKCVVTEAAIREHMEPKMVVAS